MAEEINYDVHPDFKMFPVFTVKYNWLFLSIINAIVIIQQFFTNRKLVNQATTHTIKTKDNAGLKIIEFSPEVKTDKAMPAIVYFHGGAFVLTYASTHVLLADNFAKELNCKVFFVDYRLAPKQRFPAGFNDCYESLEWVKANAEKLGKLLKP